MRPLHRAARCEHVSYRKRKVNTMSASRSLLLVIQFVRLARMQQPFSALLLEQLRQNEYRRIATFCHILACPTISDGALKGEVTTLTIV